MECCDIYCGDNAEILKKFSSDFIDLIVTSPPYGSLRKYNGFSFDLDSLSKELYRTMKPGGVIVWVVKDQIKNGKSLLIPWLHVKTLTEAGFGLYDTMIWEKPSPAAPTEGRYYDVFEYMFIFCKGNKPKVLNLLEDRANKTKGSILKKENRSNREERVYKKEKRIVKEYSRRFNVWHISREYNKTKHTAVFPYQLAKDHILTWSNPDDLVVDIFAGSGTTNLAAMDTGRKTIAIEISEEYCLIIKDRVKNARVITE